MPSRNSDTTGSAPSILIVATVWWPLAARMAMALIGHGARVSAIAPPGHFLHLVRDLVKVYPQYGFNPVEELRRAVVDSGAVAIIPCDDRAAWLLQQLQIETPELRPVVERTTGNSQNFALMRSKGLFLERAAKLGLRVPATRTVKSAGMARTAFADFGRKAVLKVDGTWGGAGVCVVSSAVDAEQGYTRLANQGGLGTALKRRFINQDRHAVWIWKHKEWFDQPITMQQYIDGQPANTMIACWQGQVLGLVTVTVMEAQGETGAATIVKLVEVPEIEYAARKMAAEFHLSGFHGFDFMLDAITGDAYLLEMNPRCTQLGHLKLPEKGDLAGLFYEKLTGRASGTDQADVSVITQPYVAFFPQARTWSAASPYMGLSHEDVPAGQPELLKELGLDLWPDRRWVSRLYHLFRPKEQQLSPRPERVSATSRTV